MATQDIIIFEPNSIAETDALIAFGTALKLKFKIAENKNYDFNDDFEMPEAHQAIVAERLADYRRNPETNMDFDLMIKNIREKYSL